MMPGPANRPVFHFTIKKPLEQSIPLSITVRGAGPRHLFLQDADIVPGSSLVENSREEHYIGGLIGN